MGTTTDFKTENKFLARMKELAVVKIHKSRHLANLYNIVQQSDELVRAFVARLTGTADMCGMQVQCSGCQQNVSYRDEVVKQMIIHGLVNIEIKQRVLSRTGNDELPTLAELVNYIAAEEISCSESLSVQSESNTVGHVRQRKSSYKNNQGKCNFCGGPRHSSSGSALLCITACQLHLPLSVSLTRPGPRTGQLSRGRLL